MQQKIDKDTEDKDLHSFCPLCGDSEVKNQRDSDITIQLTEEHREITRNLKQLNVSRRGSNSELFSQLANSLDAHFKKEEQLLFPRITRALGPFVCEKLTFEHTEIMKAAQNLGKQNVGNTPIGRLEQLFLTHIGTEENVLFWYLDVEQAIQK